MKVVSAAGEGALEPDEKAILREAGDAMFFCEDIALDDDTLVVLQRFRVIELLGGPDPGIATLTP